MQKLSLLFEQKLFWWIVGLSISIPLYPKFPLFNVPGTYVAIRLEDFLLLTIFLATFLVILPKWKDLLKNDIELAIILFLGVTFLSTLSGIFLTKTVVWYIGVLNWGRRLEYFVPFFAFQSGLVLANCFVYLNGRYGHVSFFEES